MGLSLSLVMDMVLSAVGLTFAYAAAIKIARIGRFVDGLRGYALLPDTLVYPAAILLVVGEGAAAITHLGGLALRYALPGTLFLLFVLLTATIVLLRRGDSNLPCLCFGAGRGESLDVRAPVRIGLLIVAELALIVRFVSEDRGSHVLSHAGSSAMELLIGTSLVLALLAWCFKIPEMSRLKRLCRGH